MGLVLLGVPAEYYDIINEDHHEGMAFLKDFVHETLELRAHEEDAERHPHELVPLPLPGKLEILSCIRVDSTARESIRNVENRNDCRVCQTVEHIVNLREIRRNHLAGGLEDLVDGSSIKVGSYFGLLASYRILLWSSRERKVGVGANSLLDPSFCQPGIDRVSHLLLARLWYAEIGR